MVEHYMAQGELMGKSELLFHSLTSDGRRLRSTGSKLFTFMGITPRMTESFGVPSRPVWYSQLEGRWGYCSSKFWSPRQVVQVSWWLEI